MVKQGKLKRMSGTFHKVFKVFFWASVATAVLTAVLSVVVLCAPADTWLASGTDNVVFSVGGVMRYRAELPADYTVNYKPLLLAGLGSAALGFAVFAVIHRQLAGILRTVSEDRPFTAENAGRITVIAVICLISSLMVSVLQAVVAYAGITAFALENVDIVIRPNLTMLLMGLLLLILASVFRYGSYLQDEVDATL